MIEKRKISPLMATAFVLLAALVVTGCQTGETVSINENISYETAMSHVGSRDTGGRWLSLGIREINELEGLSESDKIRINHHLFSLIEDEELRFDENLHDQFLGEMKSEGMDEVAVAALERAHVRVSSPVILHDGYWVGKIKPEGFPFALKVINVMHIDAATNLITVYAQSRMMGKVVAPAQVSPGEFTELPNGDRVASHPDAVYLNGSGQELLEDDGTGSWWVKHSWVLGGEGYGNAELKPQEHYEETYVEGNMLEDGLTMKIGDPEALWGYNLRKPVLSGNKIIYQVNRYEYSDDGTLNEGFVIEWVHKNEKSPFDGLARSGPDTKLWNLLEVEK